MTKHNSPTGYMAIKDWADTDKPREKMMAQGKAVLSNAELLAILIGSGTTHESAVALSQRILSSVSNSLTALGKQTLQQLQAFKGIGQAKAITILAATELGRRRSAELPEPLSQINSPENVFSLMQPLIGELSHEEFWVLYLSSAHRVRYHPYYCRCTLALQNGLGTGCCRYHLGTQSPLWQSYSQPRGYTTDTKGEKRRRDP